MTLQVKKQLIYKTLLVTLTFMFIFPALKINTVSAADPDGTRPKITSFELKNSDIDIKNVDDMKKIPVDSKVIIELTDDTALDLTPTGGNGPVSDNGLIIVKDSSGTSISGKTDIEDGASSNIKVLTFSPYSTNPPSSVWAAGETYTVTVSNTLKDALGNVVYPFTFKFSTSKTWAQPSPENLNPNLLNGNPHGDFAGKANICFNCHGTQKNIVLSGGKTLQDAATAFCLTCHDGTSGTNVTGKDSTFQHGVAGQTKMGTAACSDCHDSHLSWSAENPNSLKGAFVYQHKKDGSDILYLNGDPVTDAKKPCVTCHGVKTAEYQKKALDEAFTGPGNAMNFVPYQYKKQATTTGKAEDMSLCLNCHDGSKNKATDISKFYNIDPSSDLTSGHKIVFGDRGDGSLQGYLTCSDCHETHGSENIYQLKKELGHENVNGTFTAGATKPSEWTATEERTFCLKCHNGTTLTYGIIGQLNKVNAKGDNIVGHQDTDVNISCSSCHGPGGISDFIGTAHAPLKKIPATP